MLIGCYLYGHRIETPKHQPGTPLGCQPPLLLSRGGSRQVDGHGKNLPERTLEQIGYDVKKFSYPESWDSYPTLWG